MHLRGMLADLDNHIQRRAEDLAEPMIRDAEARARLAITEATGEIQRQRDLVEELRKRLAAADRMREETRRIRDQLAEALGRHRSTPMESLVAEIENRLKESDRG
jgi:predicted transcriptional regulator